MPEQGEWLPRLRALTGDYLARVAELERTRSPFAGALGMRGGPADDPCHEGYAEALRELLSDCLAAETPSGALRELLAEIYAVPPADCPRSAFWMLLAVHGLTDEAALRLSAGDAGALAARYRKDYPRHRRLPAQVRVLRLLEQRAGE